MPWFEERSLFVGDTQIRRYEPGVREGWIDVDAEPDRRLPLEAGGHRVVHGHRLVRQHDGIHSKHPRAQEHDRLSKPRGVPFFGEDPRLGMGGLGTARVGWLVADTQRRIAHLRFTLLREAIRLAVRPRNRINK